MSVPAILVSHPVIVICIPAYNEERYLARAIASLQSQGWTDFAVLICDNASTDRTAEIALAAAESDPRIHYHRHSANIGAAANFNFGLDATDSPLMMWLGAHDYLATDFLAKLVPPMLADETLSVSYCPASWVDDGDRIFAQTGSPKMARLPRNAMARFVKAAAHIDYCTEVNNVLRRNFIGARFSNVYGCDHLLLAELAFRGPFHRVPDPLYNFYVVGQDERAEDYMERLTGKAGVVEDRALAVRTFEARFREIAQGRPLRPLAAMVLRGILHKRYTPHQAGPMGRLFLFLASIKQWRARTVEAAA